MNTTHQFLVTWRNKYGGVILHGTGPWGRRLNEEDNKPPCQYSGGNGVARFSPTGYAIQLF